MGDDFGFLHGAFERGEELNTRAECPPIFVGVAFAELFSLFDGCHNVSFFVC